MTTAADFMRTIIAAPNDDQPRLQLADWLEENGEPERAEFTRVQCELAKHPECTKGMYGAPCSVCDFCALSRRERELLESHSANWWIDEVAKPCRLYDELDVTSFEHGGQKVIERVLWSLSPIWRRGFVHSLACTAAQFAQRGAEILRMQPVEMVTLTGLSHWSHLETIPSIVKGSSVREVVFEQSSIAGHPDFDIVWQQWIAEQLPGIAVSVRREPEWARRHA